MVEDEIEILERVRAVARVAGDVGDLQHRRQHHAHRIVPIVELSGAKIDAGAYVYFTFLRPFAELAGVELDWTVPRDSTDLYPFLELVDGALPGDVVEETVETYYQVIP